MAALVGLCPTADFQPLLPYKCTGGSGLPRPQGTHRQRMFVWLLQDSGDERYFRDRLTQTCRCHGSRMWTGWLGGGIRSSLGKAWARVRGVISWGCTPGLINPEQPYHSLTHRLSSIHPSIRILGALLIIGTNHFRGSPFQRIYFGWAEKLSSQSGFLLDLRQS